MTPLEKLRIEKQMLKKSCKEQELALQTSFMQINGKMISAASKTLLNPNRFAALLNKFIQKESIALNLNEVHSMALTKVLEWVLKFALAFVINKRFGKKSPTGKILAMILPMATPIMSAALKKTKPTITKATKSGIHAFFALKNWKKNQ